MIGFSLPKQAATATYSYRYTGGLWSSEKNMSHGFAEPTRTFSSPACDELRITLTYSDSTAFHRAFLSTLSITSGLSFSLDIGATNYTYSQDEEPSGISPRQKQNQNYRFSETSGNSVVLTITGIAQSSLSFGQFVMASLEFTPTLNIQRDSELSSFKTYSEQRTRLGFIQKLDNSARSYGLSFLKLTNDEFDDLENLVDVKANDGFLLFELDQSSDRLDNAFLCYSSITQIEPKYIDFNSASMNIMEAYSRG